MRKLYLTGYAMKWDREDGPVFVKPREVSGGKMLDLMKVI